MLTLTNIPLENCSGGWLEPSLWGNRILWDARPSQSATLNTERRRSRRSKLEPKIERLTALSKVRNLRLIMLRPSKTIISFNASLRVKKRERSLTKLVRNCWVKRRQYCPSTTCKSVRRSLTLRIPRSWFLNQWCQTWTMIGCWLKLKLKLK